MIATLSSVAPPAATKSYPEPTLLAMGERLPKANTSFAAVNSTALVALDYAADRALAPRSAELRNDIEPMRNQ